MKVAMKANTEEDYQFILATLSAAANTAAAIPDYSLRDEIGAIKAKVLLRLEGLKNPPPRNPTPPNLRRIK